MASIVISEKCIITNLDSFNLMVGRNMALVFKCLANCTGFSNFNELVR